MEEQFIPYEQALELKELGFNEPCMGYYTIFLSGNVDLLQFNSDTIELLCTPESVKFVKAPLWQQAFDWFRIKYELFSTITCGSKFSSYYIVNPNMELHKRTSFQLWDSAKLECLKKLIEIQTLKNEKEI